MRQQMHHWWQQWLISTDKAATQWRDAFGRSRVNVHTEKPLHLSGLEPRILFSATPIDPAMLPGGDEVAMVMEMDAASPPVSTIDNLAQSNVQQQSSRELVFIDGSVPDIEQLLDDLNSSGRNAEVFLLDSDRDGIDQISEILDSRSDIDSIHLVSHAEDGAVKLGNLWLGESNLAGYAGQLASWQTSLTRDADILLYGCDLAADPSGQTLIESISALTGADVAASDDDTGHASFSGDWDLEYTTGDVESTVVFTSQLQENWVGKLATITVDTFDDEVSANGFTSLREAIIQANAGGGGDTIVLAAGTYTLSIGSGDDNAAQGDLDIVRSVTITGAGATSTIIDGGGIDRVFELRDGSASVTISDLTIQGGSINDKGGGIHVQHSSSTLVLNRVIVQNNFGDNGAGIFNEGTITLTDVVIANNGNEITTTEGGGINNNGIAILDRVTISGNKADEGGGIHNDSSSGADIALANVTVSGNTAASAGGGLYTQNTATIINSTFTLNTADSGGGIRVQSGNTTLTNTIVAGNSSTSANDDVMGTFVVGSSFNLIGDGTGSSNLVHGSNGNLVGDNLTPIDAMLSPLANHGGFAATHAFAFASPARDGGTTSGAPSLDQRGITRDTTPDIGALEFVAGLLVVDTTFDVLDGDTTSVASLLASKGSDGFISLREAIIATNNDLGANTIILGTGTHTLSIAGVNEQNAATGDLDIQDELTIIGAGSANTIVDGNGLDRVFDIVGGPTVTIQDLTVQGGNAGNKWGAGVNIENGGTINLNRLVIRNNQVNGSGGGVYNFQGALTMTDTTLSGNSADYGGGFYNDKGVAILNRVTANDNSATDSGGGLYNFGPGANMMLTNVTVSGNSATGTGGGIYTNRADTFTNVTVAYNTAATTGGIHIVNPGSVTLKNSIVAFNTGGNANQAVIDAGNNLDSENSLGISGLINTNPELTALNYNGGFTQTHAITTLSAAYNAGTLSGAPATDQRGEARDGSPDIGAYEVTAILTNTGEFRVNDTTTDQQVTSAEDRGSQRAVAMAGDGSFVVVWSSLNQDGSGQGVYFQRFHATGAAITGELRANETPTNDQQWAHVASAPDGSFVVTWTSTQSGNEDVYFRKFAANGTALTGELLANDTTTGIQKNSSIAIEDNGDFVVTWQGQGPLDANGIHFRRFNADGTAKDTADKLANTNGTNSEIDPVIAMQQSGAFVIGWVNETTNKIHFNRFNSAGSAIGGGQIDNGLAVSSDLAVASDGDGNFTFVYRDNGIGPGVWRRGYNADGTQQYGYLQLSSGDAASPSIDMADDGTHVVTWHKSGGAGLDVFAQKFNADGSSNGGVFQVNVTSAGTQWKSSLAMVDPENFVVVWSGNGNQSGEVDTSGVFARQFGTAVGNLAPTVVDPMIDQLATQGTFFSFTFASNTFDDANGDSLLYSAMLDDSSPLPTWLTFDDTTRTFSGTPTNADVGSITIRLTADDGNGGTVFDDFVLTINNTNDWPTGITLDNTNVDENAYGLLIGNLSVVDPDIGDTHTLSVNDARFEIIGTQLRLQAGQSLDQETEPTVNLTITATDQAGTGLSFVQAFTIVVNDVNEAPTDITLSNSTVSENADGALIGSLIAMDSDVGDTHTFSVDDARFEVVGNQLKLKSTESLDHDIEPSVVVVLTAIDQGGTGLIYNKSFTLNVVAIAPPVIPLPPTASVVPAEPPAESSTEEASSDDSDSEYDHSEAEVSSEVAGGDVGSQNRRSADDRNVGPAVTLVGISSTGNDAAAASSLSAASADIFLQTSISANSQVDGIGNQASSENDLSRDDQTSDQLRQQLNLYSQADFVLMSRPGKMWDQFDEQRNFVESQIQGDLIVIGTTGAAASSFTVGVVAWALRSGFLVSGLMAQLPLYRAVDPLLIMGRSGTHQSGETLEELMDRQSKELDS